MSFEPAIATGFGDLVFVMNDAVPAPWPGGTPIAWTSVIVRTARVGSRQGDDFYGTHVVLAARIASQASGGDILVSALLRELVAASREFALEPRPPVALKGLPGEHVVYRVAWE